MSSNSPRIAASAFHAVGGGGDALFAAPLKPVAEPAPAPASNAVLLVSKCRARSALVCVIHCMA